MLCDGVELKVGNISFISDCDEEQNIIKKLKNAYLIYVDDDSRIKLLTKYCRCAIVPGYGCVAADDYDGRFSEWIKKQMMKNRGR